MSYLCARMSDATRKTLLKAAHVSDWRTVQDIAVRAKQNVTRVRVNLHLLLIEGKVDREERALPGGGRQGVYRRAKRLSPHLPLYPHNMATNFEPLARCFDGYTYRK